MKPPDRVTVPTCVGCGAMSRPGTCREGCGEHKLELVRAADYDVWATFASSVRVRAHAFTAVTAELISRQPSGDGWEVAYRSVQDLARVILRQYPEVEAPDPDGNEPDGFATTWWCAACGGIDAPQPCLGICVWRDVEWVNRSRYRKQQTCSLDERDTEQRLARLVRRVAFVTPRPGQWESGWLALQAQSREARQAGRSDWFTRSAPDESIDRMSWAPAGGEFPRSSER